MQPDKINRLVDVSKYYVLAEHRRMVDPGVDLHSAPSAFFPELWARLIKHTRSESAALALLNDDRPDLDIPQDHPGYADLLSRQKHWDYGRQLSAELKAAIADGRLVAFGYLRGNDVRTEIPGDRVRELWPRFFRDVMEGSDLTYRGVLICDCSAAPNRKTEKFFEVFRFIESRKAEGVASMKEAVFSARKQFPSIKQRYLELLQSLVYDRRRGRPFRRTKG